MSGFISPSSQITALESGLSTVRFDGDYAFDLFLEQGGAESDQDVDHMNYARLLWQLYRKKQTMKKLRKQVQTLQKNSSFEMIAQLSDITRSAQVKRAVTR